jgi:hypothetical protein
MSANGSLKALWDEFGGIERKEKEKVEIIEDADDRPKEGVKDKGKIIVEEQRLTGIVKPKVYFAYLTPGHWLHAIPAILLVIAYQGTGTMAP